MHTGHSIVGRSPVVRRVREKIAALSGTRLPVLICGEAGTGRDLLAQSLYESERENIGFVKIGPSDAVGTLPRLAGKLVYLDNIEGHPISSQARWAQLVLEIEGNGENAARRVIASTCEDILTLSLNGKFDQQLASSIGRFVVEIPTLRERRSDIAELARFFAARTAAAIGRPEVVLTRSAIALLQKQSWPGNVSELSKVVERVVVFSTDGVITRKCVSEALEESPGSVRMCRDATRRQQREDLSYAIKASGGNLAEVARRMGMSRGAIIYRAQKFGLLEKRG